jgi:hypothetical protein
MGFGVFQCCILILIYKKRAKRNRTKFFFLKIKLHKGDKSNNRKCWVKSSSQATQFTQSSFVNIFLGAGQSCIYSMDLLYMSEGVFIGHQSSYFT